MSEPPSVSRRALLSYVSAGVAAAGAAPSSAPRPGPKGVTAAPLASLLAPLGPGSVLGRWRVERLVEPSGGAASIVLSDRSGTEFQLDLCARDGSALASHGPACTEHFELFVANQGDGATGTHEDHGLCAMAVGEVIRANEAEADRGAFVSLADCSDARRHVRS